MMARYNAWQNSEIRKLVEAMPEAELTEDRGAFFGSIFATLNHILWADVFWLYRLGVGEKPDFAGSKHTEATPTIHVWGAERFKVDGRINEWTRLLKAVDLTGDVEWTSVLKDQKMSTPRAQCIMHMFNHQTHHRGQVHAMLTASGQKTTDTDLVFLDVQ